ncbi:MAG: patatin-like phospholipase family protein [Clostridiales bacterium]|nr:patatin-like phospholipase family protein [Clostridiales bacterium]
MKKTKLLIFALIFLIRAGWPEERPKIGLVLSGGGAKGLAHIPVLKQLDELSIPIDYIAGTSAGGIIGALYALGYSGAELERIAAAINWEDIFVDRPPRSMLPFFEREADGRYQLEFFFKRGVPSAPRGLVYGQKFSLFFSQLTFPLAGEIDFNLLPVPFRCVTVDLITGKEVVLGKGSLAKAMRATMAVPTIFTPVEWEGRLLVDGGLLNNLPVDVVKNMGADIVIAVDLGSPLSGRDELGSADKILSQALRIAEIEQKKKNAELADILIVPDMKGLSSGDFFFPDKLAKIKEKGKEAASKSLPALAALKKEYGLERSQEAGKKSSQSDQSKKFILDRITVSGNDKLPASVISSAFSLKRGDPVDGPAISRQVLKLYALGYFENIESSVFTADKDRIELRLQVKEFPRAKLRIGIAYNNFRKLVTTSGLCLNNLPLPGMRLESELDLVGLTRFRSKIVYQSLTMNFPLCPYLELNYRSIPTRLYDGEGSLITTYDNKSWTTGVGVSLLLKKGIILETAYEIENTDMGPLRALPLLESLSGRRDHLQRLKLSATIDTLDAVWTPKKGLLFKMNYEKSNDFLGTDIPYDLFEASADVYGTFLKDHTLRFYGYIGTSSAGTPFYKYLNQGHPDRFVGMDYDQLIGNQMKIIRAEYRYRLTGLIHLKAAANVALDFEQRWPLTTFDPDPLWGLGAGIHISTPAGSVELVYSVGSKSFFQPKSAQGVAYLVLGAKF